MKTNTNEMENRRREVICLCGSTKFKEQILEVAKTQSLKGKIVLLPLVFSRADSLGLTEEQKEMLDSAGLDKITLADEVYVIDVEGYIGESTRREIDYALASGKPARYYSKMGVRG